MKQRKTPMRMCVGCREMQPKRDMVRIVRTPEGAVKVDRTGKLSGRGAYVCEKPECLVKAQKAKLLEKALEAKLEPETYEQLAKEIERHAFG